MTGLLAAFGDEAEGHLDLLLAAVEASNWQRGSGARLAVAIRRPPLPPGRDDALFLAPDGRCNGALVGSLFGGAAASGWERAEPGPTLHAAATRCGPSAVADLLDGAFALVLEAAGEVVASRDAIGEQPLYYLPIPGAVVLSDRLAPLLAHPACTRRLDPGGVFDLLATGFCPFERTPVQGVRKLPPGASLRWRDGARVEQWYRIDGSGEALGGSEEEVVRQLRALLEGAVERRRAPGRRSGLLLSGGLDSSLVGALLGKAELTAAWSISFGPGHRNELEHSALVARHLGIEQRVVEILPETVRGALEDCARVLDEPIGDPLTVPNLVVARAAAREAEVLFNGEGGDPLFGGPKNLPLLAAAAYASHLPPPPLEELYLASYQKGYPELPRFLTPAFYATVRDQPATTALLSPHLAAPGLGSHLDRLMYANLRLKGAGQILPKVTKAAAAAGVSVRSPLFDRRLAEAAFRIAPELKLKGTREKHVLKEAVRDLLPPEIVERPKSGMLVPVMAWFRDELEPFASDLLLGSDARTAPLFRRPEVERLLAYQGGGVRGFHGPRIWLLLSLEAWMRAHRIGC